MLDINYEKVFDEQLLYFQKNYIIYKVFLSFNINNIHNYFNKTYKQLVLKLNKISSNQHLPVNFFNSTIKDFYYSHITINNKDNSEELNFSKQNIEINLRKTIRIFLSKEKFKELQKYLIKSPKSHSYFTTLSKKYNIFLMKKLSDLSSISEVDFSSFFSDITSINNLLCVCALYYSRKRLHSYLCYLILNTMLSFYKCKITPENLYRKVKDRIKFSYIKSLDITFDLYFDIII